MNITVQRRRTNKATTFGDLAVDGAWLCYTLEDVIREVPGQPVEAWKVYGETAIPSGRYEVVLVTSPKFGKDTLSLLDVPGFKEIRIHAGNDDADTHGCLLVGRKIVEMADDGGNILQSKAALAALKALVVPAIRRGDHVWIDVGNP